MFPATRACIQVHYTPAPASFCVYNSHVPRPMPFSVSRKLSQGLGSEVMHVHEARSRKVVEWQLSAPTSTVAILEQRVKIANLHYL